VSAVTWTKGWLLATGLVGIAASGCAKRDGCPHGTTRGAVAVEGAEVGWFLCQEPGGAVSFAVRGGPDGRLVEQCPVEGTKIEGTYSAWHGDGTLFLRGPYRDGQKQGTWEQWSPVGARVASGSYRDGVIVAGAPVGTQVSCERLRFRR